MKRQQIKITHEWDKEPFYPSIIASAFWLIVIIYIGIYHWDTLVKSDIIWLMIGAIGLIIAIYKSLGKGKKTFIEGVKK